MKRATCSELLFLQSKKSSCQGTNHFRQFYGFLCVFCGRLIAWVTSANGVICKCVQVLWINFKEYFIGRTKIAQHQEIVRFWKIRAFGNQQSLDIFFGTLLGMEARAKGKRLFSFQCGTCQSKVFLCVRRPCKWVSCFGHIVPCRASRFP